MASKASFARPSAGTARRAATRTIRARTIGARTIGARTIGARTIGARTIGARTIGAGATAATAAAAVALLAAGCSAQHATGQSAGNRPGAAGIARTLPLGDPALDPRVRGLTVLVVGDSWARNLGVGIADADRARRNVVVNAGMGGCGVMQPVQIRAKGKLVPAPARCNTWPTRWRDLVTKYHPAAVLLEVGYWDGQDSQRLSGTKDVGSITEPAFRRRFDAQIDRAIRILGAGGARVYLPTVIDNDGAARANSDAMNVAIRAAVRRNHRSARLLDLHGQLCTAAKVCPAEIRGIRVYDDTAHPTGPAHDRLGAWLLDSMYADLHRTISSGTYAGAAAGGTGAETARKYKTDKDKTDKER